VVWFGLVWFGMVQYSMGRIGMAKYGMVWFGSVWYGTTMATIKQIQTTSTRSIDAVSNISDMKVETPLS
jgi:hypothetical protein